MDNVLIKPYLLATYFNLQQFRRKPFSSFLAKTFILPTKEEEKTRL